MQLPVDVKALLNEVTDINAAREMPLAVSVYIDSSAPSELAAHVRNAFASSDPRVRMTVTYIEGSFIPHPADDIAIIVTGASKSAGEHAETVRSVGVPVMVVTLDAEGVAKKSLEGGAEIPEGDIIAPKGAALDTGGTIGSEVATALNEHIVKCRGHRLVLGTVRNGT